MMVFVSLGVLVHSLVSPAWGRRDVWEPQAREPWWIARVKVLWLTEFVMGLL